MEATSFPYIIVWIANRNETEIVYVIYRHTHILLKNEWILGLGKSVCYKRLQQGSLSHDTLLFRLHATLRLSNENSYHGKTGSS